MAAPAVASGQSITLAQGTASADGWKFNGSAAVTGGEFVLTPPLAGKSASIFNQQRIRLGTDYSFSAAFTFKISESGNGGADGIVFTLQTQSDSAGTEGFGIGYSDIDNSLGIEFDTYHNNWSPIWDPNGNHIGIDYNGDVQSVQTADVSPINLEDGALKYAWVDYNGATGNLEVRLANDSTRPVSPKLSRTVDVPGLLEQPYAYVGFTSATGASWSKHAVGSLFFDNSYHPSGLDLTGATPYTQNQAPTAASQSVNVNRLVYVGQVAGTDPDGDVLTYHVVDAPTKGTVTINPDGTFQYTPTTGFTGTDAFTYRAVDSDQVSNLATVTLNVSAPVDDTDGDGIPNSSDPDIDNDGIPNGSDPDTDGDGIPNTHDPDIDNDEVPNKTDSDIDGDGIPNATDPDADGDNRKNADDLLPNGPGTMPTNPREPKAGPDSGGKFKPAPPKSFVAVMTEAQMIASNQPPVALTPAICQIVDTRVITIKPGTCKFKINGKTYKLAVQSSARKQVNTAKLRKLAVIKFKSDSTQLLPGQSKKLRKAKRVLNGAPAIAFARAYNAGMGDNDLPLSQARGRVIQSVLGSKRAIQVVALGSSLPVSNRAVANRTVTVYW